MNALPPADRDRLVAILARLASDFAGERDAAALAATRLLRARGVTWADVIGSAPAQPWTPPPRRSPPRSGWHEVAHRCRARAGDLNLWEQELLATFDKLSCLSAEHVAFIREIAERIGVMEAAR